MQKNEGMTASFFIGACVMLCLCNSSAYTQTTPQGVIKKYERLVREMKADSLSLLFTDNAEVGHENQRPIRGRDSIYQFLSSFKNVRVVYNIDSISKVSIINDSARVEGVYRQGVILSGTDTVHVAGYFTADLTRELSKKWLIRKMKTRSL